MEEEELVTKMLPLKVTRPKEVEGPFLMVQFKVEHLLRAVMAYNDAWKAHQTATPGAPLPTHAAAIVKFPEDAWGRVSVLPPERSREAVVMVAVTTDRPHPFEFQADLSKQMSMEATKHK